MRGFRRMLARAAARGGILLFVVVALEVMVMISPFAFFFYSVFNPFFHWLDRFAATRWLTGFYLPHMILPPTLLLQGIRVLGSVLFVAGCVAFVVCALQVYLGKALKRGVAERGLYRYVRHPQYLSLVVWGMGMAILWPRFLVLATLAAMLLVYYWLARDEEKRMLAQHGEAYARYLESHGMFLPKAVEDRLAVLGRIGGPPALRRAGACAAVLACLIGAGFLLRAITLHSLLFASEGNVTVVPILPEDGALNAKVLADIRRGLEGGGAAALSAGKDYLAYVMPPDYIMQGLLADTGGKAHLFKQHHTLAFITDWVLHPFGHLRRPPSAEMARMRGMDPTMMRRRQCPLGIRRPGLDCAHCPYRRVILVQVSHAGAAPASGAALMGFGTRHVPALAVDINTGTGRIVDRINVRRSTAWGNVPTPEF